MKNTLTLIIILCSINVFSQKKAENKQTISCQIATIQRDSVFAKSKEYPTQVKMLEAYQKQLQSEYEE